MTSSEGIGTGSGLFRRSSVPQQNVKPSSASFVPTSQPALFGSTNKTKKECFVFEPQQWRKTVCKNCFRTQPEHRQPGSSNDEPNDMGSGVMTSVVPILDPSPNYDPKNGIGRDLAKGNGTQTTTINAARVAARKNAAVQRSTEDTRTTAAHPEPRRIGPSGSNTQTQVGIHSSASSIDTRYVEELENDFFALEDKHEAVLRERDELAAELEVKVRNVAELQVTLEQYREKLTTLERRCGHLEEEVKSYRERLRLPESDQNHSPHVTGQNVESGGTARSSPDVHCSTELQQRLNEVEQLCQEVMEENEQLKEEVEEMQREIEEMHDHFQEEDRDAMRELQRDLEAANKTCRILQFKLRKAERRFEQCEAERANLEERLARLESELYSEADIAHIHNLEEELRVAKEVGVRLNNELDLLDEKRIYYEEENRQLNEELQMCQNRRITVENELGRLKLEFDKVKTERGVLDKGPLQVTDKSRSRGGSTLSREASFEEQQLQKELDATRERETDLSEQLRFAEEEVRKMKRRLKESQSENDMLTRKLERVFSTQAQQIKSDNGNATKRIQGRLESGGSESSAAPEEDRGIRIQKVHGRLNLPGLLESETVEKDATEIERRKLRNLGRSGSSDESIDSRLNAEREKLDALSRENNALKAQFKQWNKKLQQISRDSRLLCGAEKENGWLDKYNDARETIKEQDVQLMRVKKRLAELQDENANLRANERKVEQRARRKREKNTTSELMNREALVQEISSLEEELDDVTADLTSAREQASTAQLRVTYLEDAYSEYHAEAERRERELISYIDQLEDKRNLMASLLELMLDQNSNLHKEIEGLLIPTTSEEVQGASSETSGSSSSVPSSPTPGTVKKFGNGRTGNGLEQKVESLQRLLSEAGQRIDVLQKQLELSKQQSEPPSSSNTVESPLKSKQVEILKKELEEKDEIIDARDEQIRDLKSRMEQTRKMNDAMRALMEKEPTETKVSQHHELESAVEIASYKKEIECMRKEMQILRNNILQAEKVRERWAKENRELQEELKLREDSIFDQDDELERRNNEIRSLKASIEPLQKELEQTKQELANMKATSTTGVSNRLGAKIAENERLRAELNETLKELNETKLRNEDLKRQSVQTEEKLEKTMTEFQQTHSNLLEKEQSLSETNELLRRANESVDNLKKQIQSSESVHLEREQELNDLKHKLTLKEQEYKLLQLRVEEASSNLRRREGSQESGISLSDASTSRDGTLSRRSADVDRLRRELSIMRRERDDLLTELKKLRVKLDRRHGSDEYGKRDLFGGSSNLSSGTSYAKALAAQQIPTKISLLNEHISSLNRANVELKIQNESLHNSVIDYQRRYRSLKEQYEGEQEAWLTERVVLESKAKEQEDRKLTIANTRKMLQETSAKLFEVESDYEQKLNKLQEKAEKLEREKMVLESKLVQFEEHQKLPKVLQRFGSSQASNRTSVLAAAQSRNPNHSADNPELMLKLENADRTIGKLRTEIADLKSSKAKAENIAMKEAELARQAMEQELEDIRDRLLTMECYRQQAELFRHRHFEVEEAAEKEYKIWQEERDHLIYCSEEACIMIDQWCTQLQARSDLVDDKTESTVTDVVKQMEKWQSARGRIPCLKRRVIPNDEDEGTGEGGDTDNGGMVDSTYSSDGTGVTHQPGGSVTASPLISPLRTGLMASSVTSSFSPTSFTRTNPLSAQRSTSMEWGAGRLHGFGMNTMSGLPPTHYREGSLGLTGNMPIGSAYGPTGLRGSALSLAMGTGIGGGSNYSLMAPNRCGRSVSPEVSVRKLTNYPDPTPGFLVRPTSRQGSQDSLASVTDYTQRSFTLPGKPPVRSIISPARKKFFEDTKPESVDSNSKPGLLTISRIPNSEIQHDSGLSDISAPSSKYDSPEIGHEKKPTFNLDTVTNKNTDKKPPSSPLTDTTKSEKPPINASLSIANRFARWSSSGSKSMGKASSAEPESHRKSVTATSTTTTTTTSGISSSSSGGGGSSSSSSSHPVDKSPSKTEPESDKPAKKTDRAFSSSSFFSRPSSHDKAPLSSSSSSSTSSTSKDKLTTPSKTSSSTSNLSDTSQTVKRSSSVSNISPAIMALRQKFSGNTKS